MGLKVITNIHGLSCVYNLKKTQSRYGPSNTSFVLQYIGDIT